MPCDPAAILEQAKCILTCIPPGIRPAAQVALLCNLSVLSLAQIQDWKTRIIANGGTVSNSTLIAHGNFLAEIATLLPFIRRLNTLSGDNLNAALVPIINTLGSTTDTNVSFVAGDYTPTGGLKGNGSTKHLRTGAISNDIAYDNSALLFAGSEFETTSTTNTGIGLTEANPGLQFQLNVRRPLTNPCPSFICASFGSVNKEIGFNTGNSAGYTEGILIGSVPSPAPNAGPLRCYFQGNLSDRLASATPRTAPTPAGRDCYVFASNQGAATTFTSARGYCYAICYGLTDDQIYLLGHALKRLLISLGRVTFQRDISCWGDSLTAVTVSPGYPAKMWSVMTPDQGWFNGGIGGETSTQIAARMLADTNRFSDVAVLWAGRNNFGDATQVMADLLAMSNSVDSDRFLILSILNSATEPIGSAAHTAIVALNAQIQAAWPLHYFDIRSYLVSQFNPGIPQDVIDHANDVPPSSLRTDVLHPNAAGNLLIAQQVAAFINSQGWV